MSAKRTKRIPGRKGADPDNPPLKSKQIGHLRRGIPNVRAIRSRLGMSQSRFAAAFGFSLSSIRDWEQGRHAPDANTLAYLRTVALRPEAVLRIRKEARLFVA